MRLQHAAWVKTPGVPFSSHRHFTYVKGISNQCLSVNQAAVCLVTVYAACFNLLQTPQRHRWRQVTWSSLPPVFQSWNCRGCSSVRFILFSLLPLICKMKFMRRGEGLNKESRGCGYQTLKVSAVRHWVFPSSSGHRGGPGLWFSRVLVCPAGE